MKSGKKTVGFSLDSKFSEQDYKFHHRDAECQGRWSLQLQENVPISLGSLGMCQFPLVPFMACDTCKSAYFVPGFEDLAEKTVATGIVVSDRILSGKEIRFLRIHFDLTQKDIAEKIEMESVSYYSKCETGKPNHALGPDKQVRLKLYYAIRLGISRTEDYQTISLTSGSHESNVETAPVASIKAAQIEDLVSSFKDDLDQIKQA